MDDIIINELIDELFIASKNRKILIIYPEDDTIYNWLLDVKNIKKLLFFFKECKFKYIAYNSEKNYYYLFIRWE